MQDAASWILFFTKLRTAVLESLKINFAWVLIIATETLPLLPAACHEQWLRWRAWLCYRRLQLQRHFVLHFVFGCIHVDYLLAVFKQFFKCFRSGISPFLVMNRVHIFRNGVNSDVLKYISRDRVHPWFLHKIYLGPLRCTVLQWSFIIFHIEGFYVPLLILRGYCGCQFSGVYQSECTSASSKLLCLIA